MRKFSPYWLFDWPAASSSGEGVLVPLCRIGGRLVAAGILSLAALLAAAAMAAGEERKPSVPQPQPSDFVGAETCTACHDKLAHDFAANPHSRLELDNKKVNSIAEGHKKAAYGYGFAPPGGNGGVSCENCHGPGRAHVEGGGDKTKIFNPAKAQAREVDARCLNCHQGGHPDYARTAHGKAGVGCTGCHSMHAGGADEHLLKTSQPKLCYSCHSDLRSQFSMPFRHQVNEGLMKCSDCHDTHGSFGSHLLRTTADQNAVCTKCHADTAGPFAYEHPPVRTEGCLACHTPHGSPNPRLLNVGNLNTLCLQCHSATNTTAFPHAASPIGPAHNQTGTYVACTNCHSQIHGSNASEVFFK